MVAPLNKTGKELSFPPSQEKISLHLDMRNLKRKREEMEATFCTQIEMRPATQKKVFSIEM